MGFEGDIESQSFAFAIPEVASLVSHNARESRTWIGVKFHKPIVIIVVPGIDAYRLTYEKGLIQPFKVQHPANRNDSSAMKLGLKI